MKVIVNLYRKCHHRMPSKFECSECSKSFSSSYSRDRHLSKFHESEEPDMNFDDRNPFHNDENFSANNDENLSDRIDSKAEVEIEQESDKDDTSPFNDLVCLSYGHHSGEKRINQRNSPKWR